MTDPTPSPHDWPEDWGDENGRYFCYCADCLVCFIGYKRRTQCKACHARAGSAEPPKPVEKRMSKWVPISDPMLQRRMGKTGEEVCELGAVVSRVQIQGIDEVDPSSGKTNRLRLEEEIADVYAQLDECVARLRLREPFINDRRALKRRYMQDWEAQFEEGA